MTFDEKTRVVLLGIRRDCERLSKLNTEGVHRIYRGPLAMKWHNACNGMVPPNLTGWLGREPTASERVLFGRVYAKLEAKGLLERLCPYGSGERTTHLRLTAEGEQAAAEA